MKIDRAVTINRPRAEVYQFWRTFENLPRFMRHLKSVTTSGSRSHWIASAPLDTSVEWDAEIVSDRENELITWRSLAEADIENYGSVAFRDAPGNRGTEISVNLEYSAPGGKAGQMIARLLGEEPEVQIRDDLRRLKQILEVGWVTTIDGQISGRKEDAEEQKGGLS